MSVDPVWEKIFQERASWGLYPPEELVRFVARNYYRVEDRSAVRILEIGCGPGGGPSWYVAREGFSFLGIDGSPTAIEKARARFASEGLTGQFVAGSIDKLPWGNDEIDCVIDVACLQCNAEAHAAEILREVRRVLKPGGRHFSLTLKAGSWGDGSGTRVDSSTWRDLSEGPFAHMGIVRMPNKEQIVALYRDFADVEINYSTRSMDGAHELTNWIVTCRKP